jgi:hypothetical protein
MSNTGPSKSMVMNILSFEKNADNVFDLSPNTNVDDKYDDRQISSLEDTLLEKQPRDTDVS